MPLRRRGADVVLECAGVPDAVVEGWEMARRGGTFLALGQYTDRGAVPLDPHLITRKQLRIVGSWGFAEKHYLGHIEALPRLAARFDLPRLITRYNLEDANDCIARHGRRPRDEAGIRFERPLAPASMRGIRQAGQPLGAYRRSVSFRPFAGRAPNSP